MKIHIETLLQKVEELEKKHYLEMTQVDQRIKELLRDKVRLEELLNLRESDSEKIKEENQSLKSQLDRTRELSLSQENQILELKKELEN